MRGLQALPCLSTMDLVYLGARLLWSISQCIVDLGLFLVNDIGAYLQWSISQCIRAAVLPTIVD